MTEVINRPVRVFGEATELDQFFNDALSKHFSFDYHIDRSGNCVGQVTVRNVRNFARPLIATFSVRKDLLENELYVKSLIEKALRVALYSTSK